MGIERTGLPLATRLTGATRPDAVVVEALLDAIPPIRQPNGRRRQPSDRRHVDTGDDDPRGRSTRPPRPIQVPIARTGSERGDRLDRHRWVVARPLARLNQCRRGRDERRAGCHEAFPTLGGCLICVNARPCPVLIGALAL